MAEVLRRTTKRPDPRDSVHEEDRSKWNEEKVVRGPSGKERYVTTRCGRFLPVAATSIGGRKVTCDECKR